MGKDKALYTFMVFVLVASVAGFTFGVVTGIERYYICCITAILAAMYCHENQSVIAPNRVR